MSAAHVLVRAAGVTLIACGAHFLVRALTGKTPFEHARDLLGSKGSRTFDALLTTMKREPPVQPSPPTDPVDESSWESFPASDSPAHSPKNA